MQAFTDYEINNALARNVENRTLIEGAELTLNGRVWSDRYAVNRLIIAVLWRLAVQAERAVERYAVHVAAIAPYLAKCIPSVAVAPVISK